MATKTSVWSCMRHTLWPFLTGRVSVLALGILLLAVFFRFYRLSDRFGLGYDQAFYTETALYALRHLKLPLLGVFSSGGPFQYGPHWLWIVGIGLVLFPAGFLGPWILMAILSVLFVWGMILVGRKLGGMETGLVAGLLAAASTAQVSQASDLNPQSVIGIITLLIVAVTVRYLKEGALKYLFFLGILLGIGAAIHLQSFSLFFLAPLSLFLGKNKQWGKGIILLVLGGLIAWSPQLLIDTMRGFTNTKNMVYYYLVDQYRISLSVLGRNWKVFLGTNVPHIIAFTLSGGFKLIGVGILGAIGLKLIQAYLTKTLTRAWVVIAIMTGIGFIVLRYLRAPLFDSYTVFLQPFLILLAAWCCASILRVNKFVGFVVLLLLLGTSLKTSLADITSGVNLTDQEIRYYQESLMRDFPQQTIVLFDLQQNMKGITIPLLLSLDRAGVAGEDGRQVGITDYDQASASGIPILYQDSQGFVMVDLSSSTSGELSNAGWAKVTPKLVYDSTQWWWKKQ